MNSFSPLMGKEKKREKKCMTLTYNEGQARSCLFLIPTGSMGKLHSELSTATRDVERGSPGWEGEGKLDWNAAQEFRNA